LQVLPFLDYAGVAVFAATGALAASRKQLDIIGFLFFASITGIGGGTLRDLVLGQTPVFWVLNPAYILVSTGVAILVYFTAHMFESRYKLLLWLDAIGISAYAVMGASKGYSATDSMSIAIIMGILTATFGGILRDVLAGEPSVLLRSEVYIAAVLAGAATYTLAIVVGVPLAIAASTGFLVTFIIRGGALRYGWTFPTYKSRPGRDPDDIM
jgi:uncharacterized membrane protein YeiH